MMQRMVRWTIDDFLERMIGDHIGVVDENRPTVHKYEEAKVEVALEGEQEDVEMVGDRLGKAIHEVECMGSVGRRNDPFMMRLVEMLVQEWQM